MVTTCAGEKKYCVIARMKSHRDCREVCDDDDDGRYGNPCDNPRMLSLIGVILDLKEHLNETKKCLCLFDWETTTSSP